MSAFINSWICQNKIPSCDDPRLMAKPKIKGNIYMVFKSFCSTNPDVVVSESDVVYQNINDPKFYVEQTKIFQDTEEKYVYVCELNSSVVVQALKYEWIKLFSVE